MIINTLDPLGMQTTPYFHNLITEYIFFFQSPKLVVRNGTFEFPL